MAVFELEQVDNDDEEAYRADRITVVSDSKPAAEQCYARVSIPTPVVNEAGIKAGDKVVWDIDDNGRLVGEVI